MAQTSLRAAFVYIIPSLLIPLSGCVSVPELPNPFANKPKVESTVAPAAEKADVKPAQSTLPADIQALVDKANAGDTGSMTELGDVYRFGRNIANDDKLAFEWYKKAAEAGSGYGMAKLGDYYFYGIGTTKNLVESTKWYLKGTEFEHNKRWYCQQEYGFALLNGYGVDKNESLAIGYLTPPAQAGELRAQKQLAEAYFNIGDQPNATKWFLTAAEQGDLESQRYVGNRIRLGMGIKKDVKTGLMWLTKAANAGLLDAQTNLGILYRNGEGSDIPKNPSLAFHWYMEAAKQGDKDSQSTVGIMLHNGEGTSRNYVEAVGWMRKAADQGHAEAQYNLGYAYNQGLGVAQNYTEAMKWYQKAADQGYASALGNLGFMYNHGMGVPKDYRKGYDFYTKAAEKGSTTAMNNIGSMFEDGQYVQQNYAEAARWYLRAAEAGEGRSMRNIANMFENGNGVPFSPSQALEWYQKGANAGDVLAMERLGKAYEFGQLGLKKDVKQSNAWYKKAEQARRN